MINFLMILGWCFVVSILMSYLLKKCLEWQTVAFNTVVSVALVYIILGLIKLF